MDEKSGLIVDQAGVSVRSAADYQKTIDSRWKFLDIAFEQEFEMVHADSGATHWWIEKLLDHNLGYLPAFTYRQITLDLGGLNPLFFAPEVIATSRSIYFRTRYVSGDPTTPMRIKGFLRVFAQDITAEFLAPVEFITPSTQPGLSTVGMKILKNQGAGINSHEMSDFSINTSAKALAVHRTGLVTTDATGLLSINHRLGYPPTIFLARFIKPADWTSVFANPITENVVQAMNPAAGAKVSATTNDVFVRGAQSVLVGTWAYLITKEPAELAV